MYLGLKFQNSGYVFDTICYDSYQYICVTEGELFLQINHDVNKEYVLTKGHILILCPGIDFRLFCKEQNYRGICVIDPPGKSVHFDVPYFFNADQPLSLLVSSLELEIKITQFLSPGFTENAGQLLTALIESRLHTAHTLTQKKVLSNADTRAWISAAVETLRVGASSGQGVKDLLQKVPWDYEYFARLFKKVIGICPKTFLNNVRMRRAREMVRKKQQITSIAFDLGFSSLPHFTREYKKKFGVPPSKEGKDDAFRGKTKF